MGLVADLKSCLGRGGLHSNGAGGSRVTPGLESFPCWFLARVASPRVRTLAISPLGLFGGSQPSRHSEQNISHADQSLFDSVSQDDALPTLPSAGFVFPGNCPKGENSGVEKGRRARRDSGAWYRAVRVAKRGPRPGIVPRLRLACAPLGRVGSNPTPGASPTRSQTSLSGFSVSRVSGVSCMLPFLVGVGVCRFRAVFLLVFLF